MLDDWCTKVGRDPGEIERSTGVQGGPDGAGRQLYDLGVRLVTVGIDGRSGYDLAAIRDWIAFRDEVNAS